MGEFLKEAPFEEAMNVFYSPKEVAPLTHTIWTGDFMMLAKHNVPCPVCFNRSAALERDVTPGRYRQSFRPCSECRNAGWTMLRLPRWLARFVDRFRDA